MTNKRIPTTICGKAFSENDLEKVCEIIRNNALANRVKLSQIVCKELGWVGANGKLKEMSCRVAMLKLERKGYIKLPAPKTKNRGGCKLKKASSVLGSYFPINKTIKEIGEIEINPVKTKVESRLWNELIERYHYLGYTVLAGAQIRYLIKCREGLLGAISFSASAWKVAPRDKWIGWDSTQREKNLQLIVNNSRYLILPWVKVMHLASKVLALSARRIKMDWKERYGYEPVLLETFVEKDRFKGTCYKAANWVNVGQTQGRGKKDIRNEYALPIKDIWMYPLQKDFRARLIND